MSTSFEIMMSAQNANSAMNIAEKQAISVDQDWDHEATIYEFEDGSALVVSGPQLNAYHSREEADDAING